MNRRMFSVRGIAGRVAIFFAFSVGVTVLLLGLAGKFAPKISMPQDGAVASEADVLGLIAEARIVRLPLIESAVGTVRPVNVTTIGARLLARVVEVNLKAG